MNRPPSLKLNLSIGLVVWVIVLLFSLGNWTTIRQINLLILLGVAILTPLSLSLIKQKEKTLTSLMSISLKWHPLVIVLTGIAVFTDGLIGLVSVGWLIQALFITIIGLLHWRSKIIKPVEEFCLDVGLIYTGISGIWFVASHTTTSFLNFKTTIMTLTAAHFVFIGLGALVNSAMLGYQLRYANRKISTYRVGAWGAIISPAIVAMGITHTNMVHYVSPIEVISVVLLAFSYVYLAIVFMLWVRPTIENLRARKVLIIANATLFLTMTLALGYSLGRFTGWWSLTIENMVMWHAWFNALAFTTLSIIGWTFVIHENKP